VPTYQYSCTECGHFFEQVQSFSDDALTTCPECAGRLRKVFNAVGVVFKGSGFYRTDSRSGAANGTGDGTTTGAGKDAGGTGDTGAAAKTSTDSGSTSGSTGGSSASASSSGSSGAKSATSGSAA
jgi:putative FmdB family regulatory protein